VAVLERTFESALELQSGSQLSGLLDWYGYPASLCVHKRGGEGSVRNTSGKDSNMFTVLYSASILPLINSDGYI
jgi:hypothetical protein